MIEMNESTRGLAIFVIFLIIFSAFVKNRIFKTFIKR